MSGSPVPDRLRAAWPPADPPAGDYRTGSLRGTRPLAATALGDGAVVVAADDRGTLAAAPLAPGRDGRWRVATAGDGIAAALVALLAAPGETALDGGFVVRPAGGARDAAAAGVASDARDAAGTGVAPAVPAAAPEPERPMGVDQTNTSVVVGERLVVKWYRHPDPAGERAPALLRHLAAVGFAAAPPYAGALEWRRPDKPAITVALADGFLPGVRDGWDWTVEAVVAHLGPAHRCDAACPAGFAGDLGRLAAELHLALAMPGPELRAPFGRAGAAELAAWRAAAEATLAEAVALTAADDADAGARLRAWAPELARRLGTLEAIDGTPVQPVHGDLHVGQLPRWRDGIAVIDLDGNPALPPSVRAAPQPAARDVAQLLCSLDHVGRVVERRLAERGAVAGDAVEAWIGSAREAALAAYRTMLASAARPEFLDERLLPAFVVEQECRELVYAARFLPRWRYAPLGAIRAIVDA